MKKKILLIIIGICLLILGGLGFIAYKAMNNYTNTIKLNRGIEIPKKAGCKEIYSKDSGVNFHGDGIRYHIFSYENEDVADSMLDWGDTIRSTIHYNSYTEAIYNRIKEIDTENEYHPTISSQEILKYYYQKQEDNSEIIIVLDQKDKKLYIFESFL